MAAAGTARAAKVAPQPAAAASTRAHASRRPGRRCQALFSGDWLAPEPALSCLRSWGVQLGISAFLSWFSLLVWVF